MRTREIVVRDWRGAGAAAAAALAGAVFLPVELGVLCPLRRVTGVPCPLCGMTTSVLAMVQLDPIAAIRANPGGVVLVLAALIVVLRPRMSIVRLPGWAPNVALGAMWLWELRRFSYL